MFQFWGGLHFWGCLQFWSLLYKMLKWNQISTNCINFSVPQNFFCYELKSWIKICPKKSNYFVTFDLYLIISYLKIIPDFVFLKVKTTGLGKPDGQLFFAGEHLQASLQKSQTVLDHQDFRDLQESYLSFVTKL